MESRFPYTPRPGQLEITQKMRKAVQEKKIILAHAPTGIGKTICSLVAATTETPQRILFLTNRRSQAKIVLSEAEKIESRCTAIQSRKSLCPKWEQYITKSREKGEKVDYSEFIDYCTNSKKAGTCEYWNNMRDEDEKDWTDQAIELADEITGKMPEEAYEIATEKKMCTYEALKIAAENSNIAIVRYTHLFDPDIRRFFLERITDIRKSTAIIDEAHNLASDIAKHYSIKITERMIDNAQAQLQLMRTRKAEAEEMIELTEELKNTIWQLADENKETLVRRWELTCKKHLTELQNKINLLEKIGEAYEKQAKEEMETVVNHITSLAKKWAKIMEPDLKYVPVTYLKQTRGNRKYPVLELRCIDSKDIISKTLENIHSAILMSATLTPLKYYREILGIPQERAMTEEYPPVFPEENRRIIIDVGATSQYSYRNEKMYDLIATYCQQIIDSTPGPSAFFHPSYSFLKTIQSKLRDYTDRMWIENPNSTITQFQEEKQENTILHAVASGKFAEGIDVPNYFKAVTVIGVPLATWSEIEKHKIGYYEEHYPHRGRLYAYEIPAINKIIQAAGRAIRTPTDKAVIVAIDSRLGKRYRRYLPQYWQKEAIVTADPYQVAERIDEFWEEHGEIKLEW